MGKLLAVEGDDLVVEQVDRAFGGLRKQVLKIDGKTGDILLGDPNSAGGQPLHINADGSLAIPSLGSPQGVQVNQDDAYQYGGSKSYQPVAADLVLKSAAGKNVADGTAFLAAIMGNVLGDALTKTGNYIAGVIGAYSVTGAKGTHYPACGLLGIIMDGVSACDGAIIAAIDGDSGALEIPAMYGVRCQNSTAGSGADFGLDLQAAAHDGYLPIDSAFYKKAVVRYADDVCDLVGSATPTDGVSGTGNGVAGPGSTYRCTGTPGIYINTGTKASPSWKSITHA